MERENAGLVIWFAPYHSKPHSVQSYCALVKYRGGNSLGPVFRTLALVTKKTNEKYEGRVSNDISLPTALWAYAVNGD